MEREIMERWVAELRSGRYEQAKESLRVERDFEGQSQWRYCCLGVLCDIHRKETARGEWAYGSYDCTDGHPDENDTALTFEVIRWAGMTDSDPQVSVDDGVYVGFARDCFTQTPSLAQLNDAGWTFAQIADVIEAQYGIL